MSTRKARRSTAVETGVEEPDDNEALPAIGRRLRYLRRSRGFRLKDLAEAAGCSESLLSRVENDLVTPSLTTLHRLCRILGVSVAALLSPEESASCVVYGPNSRPPYARGEATEGDGSSAESMIPFAESRLLEGLFLRLPGNGPMCGPFEHDGEEIGYVLKGELELVVAGQSYLVGTGGSFFFRSDIPHQYRAGGASECLVIWVNTPPTF